MAFKDLFKDDNNINEKKRGRIFILSRNGHFCSSRYSYWCIWSRTPNTRLHL